MNGAFNPGNRASFGGDQRNKQGQVGSVGKFISAFGEEYDINSAFGGNTGITIYQIELANVFDILFMLMRHSYVILIA